MKMYSGPQRISKKIIPLNLLRYSLQATVTLLLIMIPTIIQIRDFSGIWFLPLIIIGVFLLIVGAIVLFSFLHYKRFTWELTENELHIYKGIIFLKRLHVPYTRIHTADINASVLERIFGLVTLKFDTAGGSHQDADAKIIGVERFAAEQIKNEIFRRKAMVGGAMDAPFQSANATSVPANAEALGNQFSADVGTYFDRNAALGQFASDTQGTVYHLSIKELILSGISSSSAMITFIVVIGVGLQFLGFITQIAQSAGAFESFFERSLNSFEQIPVGAIVVLIVIVLLFTFGLSVLGKLFTLWGFAVRRNGNNIEVNRGLFTKVNTVVSINRIQAIRVKQGILRRIFGYAEIALEKVALQGQSNDGKQQLSSNIIHPFIKKKRVDAFIREIIPEYAGTPNESVLVKLNGSALRRSFLRYARRTLLWIDIPLILVPTLLAKGLSGAYGSTWWQSYSWIFAIVIGFGFFLTAFAMITAYFVWKGRAVGFDEKFLVVRSGAYARRFIYIPRRKVQFAEMKQNPFQKHAQLATIVAFSASPMLKAVSTMDVHITLAEAFLYWVETYPLLLKK